MGASVQINAGAGRCASHGRAGVGAARRDDQPDVSDAWCEALFASGLQPSDASTAEAVAQAITVAVRQFGVDGCSPEANSASHHASLTSGRSSRRAAPTPARP